MLLRLKYSKPLFPPRFKVFQQFSSSVLLQEQMNVTVATPVVLLSGLSPFKAGSYLCLFKALIAKKKALLKEEKKKKKEMSGKAWAWISAKGEHSICPLHKVINIAHTLFNEQSLGTVTWQVSCCTFLYRHWLLSKGPVFCPKQNSTSSRWKRPCLFCPGGIAWT